MCPRLIHPRGEFRLEVGQHEETGAAPKPCPAEVRGRGTSIWEHADGGGSGVLGPAAGVHADPSLLLWRVLGSPLRTARAGAHAAASRSGFAQVPLGPGGGGGHITALPAPGLSVAGEATPCGVDVPLPSRVPSTARRSGSSP